VATLKSELVERFGLWRSFEQLEHAVARWIAFYNADRLHTALDDVRPTNSSGTPLLSESADALYADLTARQPAGKVPGWPKTAAPFATRGPCGPAEPGSHGLNRGPLPGLEAPATLAKAAPTTAAADPKP
jgi:hypothetical protein